MICVMLLVATPAGLYSSPKSQLPSLSDSRSIYTPRMFAWATHSRLGEIKFFRLKKGLAWATIFLLTRELQKNTDGFFTNSRLGELKLSWARKATSISLRRDDFSLGEHVLAWAKHLWFERPVAHFPPFLLYLLLSPSLFLSSL